MNIIKRNNAMKNAFHDADCKGEGIVLALIDTGVNPDLQWLKGRVEFGDDIRTDKKDHGTSVAGVMSEYAPEATILSYCAFPDGLGGKPAIINSALEDILYRKTNDPDRFYIVNLSLGVDIGSSFLSPNYSKMHSLIQELVKNNVPVVCAAGNDGQEKMYAYPACWQEPICVAAIDSFGKKAAFSSYHGEMDFGEIGVDVRCALSDGDTGYKCGTSFSSPTVAGKIALLASMVKKNTGEWPTEPQVYELLKKYAIDISDNGFDPYTGYGFVYTDDVEDAFHEANGNESPISILEQIVQLIQYLIGLFSNNVYANDVEVAYTRQMSLWSYGEDVKAVKDKLVELGYLKKATHDKFYKDTQSAVKQYQLDHGLKDDGVVGMLTWNSLFGSSETGSGSTIQWTRDLSKGMSGDDCKALKDRLVDLGYLHASTTKTLGSDSDGAIRAFKSANGLDGSNGIVDLETWNAIFSDSATVPPIVDVDVSEIPPNIGSYAAKQIAAALKGVSQVRKDMVLDVLQYAVDPEALPRYMYAFYGRGKNMYEKDLSFCVATKSAMRTYFNNPNYAPYYDGGRQEIMEEAALESGYTNGWWDCSGELAGLWRKHCASYIDGVKKLVSSGFDANANTLYSKYCTPTSNPKPADMAWRSGHAGIFVGAGYAVESIGGEWGVQLTKIADRRAYSFLDRKRHKMGSWSGFGKPVFYD